MESDLHSLELNILDCNKYAIEALQDQNFSTAIELLRKAKSLLKIFPKSDKSINLKAITYNNLGCFYKTQNNLKKSLLYLQQALSYEVHLPKTLSTIAGTYLNISKIYSELGDHDKSLTFSLKAIKNIEDSFKDKPSVVYSLVVAYQHAGSQYFRLGHKADAKIFTAQGYELAIKYFGLNSEITKDLENQLERYKGNFKEKGNSVVDKMIGYFEKHMSNGKYAFAQEWNLEKRNYKGRNVRSLVPISEFREGRSKKNHFSQASRKVTLSSLENSPQKPQNSTKRIQRFNENLSLFKGQNSKISLSNQKNPKNLPKFHSALFKSFFSRIKLKLLQSQLKSLPKSKIFQSSKPELKSSKKSLQKRSPLKKSFMEKIIFLQYEIRRFLKKCKV
jgi:tetratricopeptide (TPR) repeat protein